MVFWTRWGRMETSEAFSEHSPARVALCAGMTLVVDRNSVSVIDGDDELIWSMSNEDRSRVAGEIEELAIGETHPRTGERLFATVSKSGTQRIVHVWRALPDGTCEWRGSERMTQPLSANQLVAA